MTNSDVPPPATPRPEEAQTSGIVKVIEDRLPVSKRPTWWIILDCGHWYQWTGKDAPKGEGDFPCPECRPPIAIMPLDSQDVAPFPTDRPTPEAARSASPQLSLAVLYLRRELCGYLDTQHITSDNIGDLRRRLFMPWESAWNGIVRDETAERENKTRASSVRPDAGLAHRKEWRLVRVGEVSPEYGGHGTWVETNHPAVVACMDSAPPCADKGCQYQTLAAHDGSSLPTEHRAEQQLTQLCRRFGIEDPSKLDHEVEWIQEELAAARKTIVALRASQS